MTAEKETFVRERYLVLLKDALRDGDKGFNDVHAIQLSSDVYDMSVLGGGFIPTDVKEIK